MWKTGCLHRRDDRKQLIWVSSDTKRWGTTTLTVTLPYASSDTRARRNHPVEWAVGIRWVHIIRYVLIRSESLRSLPLFCGLYSMHIDYVSYPGETWQKIEARQANIVPDESWESTSKLLNTVFLPFALRAVLHIYITDVANHYLNLSWWDRAKKKLPDEPHIIQSTLWE